MASHLLKMHWSRKVLVAQSRNPGKFDFYMTTLELRKSQMKAFNKLLKYECNRFYVEIRKRKSRIFQACRQNNH